MSKVMMPCPFSNKACVECAIYRGRHLYLCSPKACCERDWDMSQNAAMKLRKAHSNKDERSKMRTANTTRVTLISNVEDLIEAEEFSRFGEERRIA